MMEDIERPAIIRYFENMVDPGRENKNHKLIDIIMGSIKEVAFYSSEL